MQYGFVILHYNAYEMTMECVESLLGRFGCYNIHIVIVDNGSSNDGIHTIAKAYCDKASVDIIVNKKNEGFAKGNNIGYKWLIENYNCDYIIVMNNDVIIAQKDFLDIVSELYTKYSFAVLGPDIYNPNTKKHQNPLSNTPRTLEEVKRRKTIFYRNYILSPIYYTYRILYDLFHRKNLNRGGGGSDQASSEIRKNVVLHGACLIFSKQFISKRSLCFNPATFLYHEEDILHIECRRDALSLLYSPEIQVVHYEDVSTNASHKNKYRRMKNMYKNLYDSACVLYEIMGKE